MKKEDCRYQYFYFDTFISFNIGGLFHQQRVRMIIILKKYAITFCDSKRRIERERKDIVFVFVQQQHLKVTWQPWGNMCYFKCVIINNWYNSLSNTLVGNGAIILFSDSFK